MKRSAGRDYPCCPFLPGTLQDQIRYPSRTEIEKLRNCVLPFLKTRETCPHPPLSGCLRTFNQRVNLRLPFFPTSSSKEILALYQIGIVWRICGMRLSSRYPWDVRSIPEGTKMAHG